MKRKKEGKEEKIENTIIKKLLKIFGSSIITCFHIRLIGLHKKKWNKIEKKKLKKKLTKYLTIRKWQ